MVTCSFHNFIIIFLLFLRPITAFSSKNGTVFFRDGKYHIEFGVLDSRNGVAYGTYEDAINTTGWGVLNVVSGTGAVSYSDKVIMFAAGYLEGALTAERIYENYVNIYDVFFRKSPASLVDKAAEWLNSQEEWMRNKIANESGSSSLWRQMGQIIAQFDGLITGYTDHPAATEKVLRKFAFQLLNAVGDLFEILHVLNPERLPNWDKMEENEIFTMLGRRGHCSALIKVLPGYEDIVAGHSSWYAYSSMLRIYKHYHFNLKDASTAAKRMSFSSYPGFLVSLDDFYIMDSGIVMLQTTNDLLNNSLLQFVTPESLLAWHRVRLSNLMAHNGEEWANIYKQYNSGTYNNQYMVLDLKKVELKKPLQKGALWVVEQIPGLVVSGDQTEILSAGYWPSYNKPFYEEIYKLSGFPEFVKKHGAQYSYQLSPRAKIFRRDQGKVVDVDSLKHLLRYNDYRHDEYSEGNPYKAICARGDLLIPHDRSADGCYDSKVTNYFMAKSMVSEAISGPTHQGLPVFCWNNFSFPDKHVGMPDCYNFDFVPMKPKF